MTASGTPKTTNTNNHSIVCRFLDQAINDAINQSIDKRIPNINPSNSASLRLGRFKHLTGYNIRKNVSIATEHLPACQLFTAFVEANVSLAPRRHEKGCDSENVGWHSVRYLTRNFLLEKGDSKRKRFILT